MSEAPTAWFSAARAHVEDDEALERMTADLPPRIARFILEMSQPENHLAGGMRYADELRRAYWVFHDQNGNLMCIAFHGVTAAQADAIWKGLHDRLSGGGEIDGPFLAGLYRQSTSAAGAAIASSEG
jgi:hypothetical protein